MAKKYRTILFWGAVALGLLLGAERILSGAIDNDSPDLVITEFMAANQRGLTDEEGDYVDWLEIYNPHRYAVNLSGYALTDDPNQPEKWRFPDRTLAGQTYLVVFASGKNRTSPDDLHTNFKLNQSGEFLALHDILADKSFPIAPTHYPPQFNDVAYGRYDATAAYGFLTAPTPGQPNVATLAWAGVVAPVNFSVARGFYEAPFSLELTTQTPETTIYYTLDGSEPSASNGLVYSEPLRIDHTTLVRAIALKPNYRPSYLDTHSYIFLAEVLRQPAAPPGFPSEWGSHSKTIAGYTKGEPVLADYEMDPEIVNDPRYRERLTADLKAIPTLSLVTAAENLSIYGEPRMRGPSWERPVSVEFIDPSGVQSGFQINAGLRMQGGEVRWEYIPKHSFRLFFKEMYGASKLEYPLFPDSPVDSFDTLVLRAGTSESYAGRPLGDLRQTTYARDEWLRASQIAMSGVGAHGIFVHLYLDGLYWGLYNLVERPDASFTSAYLGGDRAEWFAIKHGFVNDEESPGQEDWLALNHGEPISGARTRYETLHRLVREGGLADPERYALLKTYVDTARFIDYILLNWYAGRTGDWARNNWYAGLKNPEGQLLYFMWDGENIFAGGPRIFLGEPKSRNMFKPLFEALLTNPDFRLELADRTYKHLFNEGALTDENSQRRWREVTALVEQAIVAESARWGDTRYEMPVTYEDWVQAREAVLAQIAGNEAKLIAQMREAEYYPPFDPPLFNKQGGLVSRDFALTMSLSGPVQEGVIYYTTDDSDPRLSGTGEVAPNAWPYRQPILITDTTQLKARLLVQENSGPVWSALQEATFQVAVRDAGLRLTEIMYNPADDDNYEFIELENISSRELGLSGLTFSGIAFTFPANSPPLSPAETVVLVRNPLAFAEKYPGVEIGGSYQGQLSNKGETLTLADRAGNVLFEVTYNDEDGWPISPDGRGDSLVLIDPTGDLTNPKNWRASTVLYGSPGWAEISYNLRD